jgi:2,3,4,5-tetrahydropyridine-2-carboxylate N-succinyltransferase
MSPATNVIAELRTIIEEGAANPPPAGSDAELRLRASVESVIGLLDRGVIRVATREDQNGVDSPWTTHAWIKRAILLYFKYEPMALMEVGPFVYHDKIPLKSNYKDLKVRVVPPAVARFGSFMEPGVILMPSYVNIGAWVGAGTMVDTWATVGSCAQIGANVHLSGGVGIGGVLEPPSANPVIVEDGAFLGSRCIVVEGVRIGREAVLAANTTLTASTPIIDTRKPGMPEIKGHVPARCVVVPGTKEKEIAGGKIFTSCAYIIGERKPSTDLKTSLNDTLREFSLSV